MRFRVLNENPLKDYQEACKITQGIDWGYSDYQFEPKNETEYWIKQIVANHSTLRAVRFRMVDEAPKSVIMQIIRATKGVKLADFQRVEGRAGLRKGMAKTSPL